MLPILPEKLRTCAEVIVRVGLNLQPGQRLLIAEPYELQGVSPDAAPLIDAVSAAVLQAGCPAPEVLWGDAVRLRRYAEQADWSGFTRLVSTQAHRMKTHLDGDGALLFPISGCPYLMDGVAPENVGEQRRIAWEHFGPIVQRLTHGGSQWTLVPVATSAWADAVFPDLAQERRLDALHNTVFAALRISAASDESSDVPSRDKPAPTAEPIQSWREHLASLEQERDELNIRRHKNVRYRGAGTDLTVRLPAKHRWCTAQLATKSGITFVANLPTEEVFTAPDRHSAEGTVRVSRPVNYGGTVIEGIELDFHQGLVVHARARTGAGLLQRLLNTDDGSSRIGEIAIVRNTATNSSGNVTAPEERPMAAPNWQNSGRLFYHTLLDENAANHIALGESYPFCTRALFASGLNRSLVHVDLPLDAEVTFF